VQEIAYISFARCCSFLIGTGHDLNLVVGIYSMKQIIFIAIVFILFASCQSKVVNENTYNTEFCTGSMPGINDFLTLNKTENSLDSMFAVLGKRLDSLNKEYKLKNVIKKTDFRGNRSRILLTEVSNGIETIKDKDEKDGISTFCKCEMNKDTIIIYSGVGFFGGAAISIKVYNDQFRSSFYEYADDVKPYKLNKNSEFTGEISVDSKLQYLQLDKKPTYKIGQQLTGYLILTSNEYFENRYGEKLDTNFVKVEMRFTCETK